MNLSAHFTLKSSGKFPKLILADLTGFLASAPAVTLGRMANDGRSTTLSGNPLALAGPELKVGDSAPDFEVVDPNLQPVTLKDTGTKVRIFSVVPSLDTPVCDAQTKRFEDAAGQLSDVDIYTISMDLPFAQKRFAGTFGVDRVKMLSDHRKGSFGEQYGTLIKDLRIESRAIFVIDENNKIRHVEYVKEVADHPNYDAALTAAKSAA
jgi:thiol peroxidase